MMGWFLQLMSCMIFVLFPLEVTSAHGVDFVVKPKTGAFVSGVNFTLGCAVNTSFPAGLEWRFCEIPCYDPVKIAEWIQGTPYYKPPPPGYHVDRPDNFTSYLTLLEPTISFAGNYCCQYNNADGPMWCATVNKDNKDAYLSTEADVGKVTAELPTENLPNSNSTDTSGNHRWRDGLIAGSVVFIAIVIIVVILVVIRMRKKCKRGHKRAVTGESLMDANDSGL